MKTWAWLALAAAALLLVGLIIGFAPIKADGYDCGSAFHEASDLYRSELVDTMTGGTGENSCDEARSSRQPVAWIFTGLGVLVAVAAGIAAAQPKPGSSSS